MAEKKNDLKLWQIDKTFKNPGNISIKFTGQVNAKQKGATRMGTYEWSAGGLVGKQSMGVEEFITHLMEGKVTRDLIASTLNVGGKVGLNVSDDLINNLKLTKPQTQALKHAKNVLKSYHSPVRRNSPSRTGSTSERELTDRERLSDGIEGDSVTYWEVIAAPWGGPGGPDDVYGKNNPDDPSKEILFRNKDGAPVNKDEKPFLVFNTLEEAQKHYGGEVRGSTKDGEPFPFNPSTGAPTGEGTEYFTGGKGQYAIALIHQIEKKVKSKNWGKDKSLKELSEYEAESSSYGKAYYIRLKINTGEYVRPAGTGHGSSRPQPREVDSEVLENNDHPSMEGDPEKEFSALIPKESQIRQDPGDEYIEPPPRVFNPGRPVVGENENGDEFWDDDPNDIIEPEQSVPVGLPVIDVHTQLQPHKQQTFESDDENFTNFLTERYQSRMSFLNEMFNVAYKIRGTNVEYDKRKQNAIDQLLKEGERTYGLDRGVMFKQLQKMIDAVTSGSKNVDYSLLDD